MNDNSASTRNDKCVSTKNENTVIIGNDVKNKKSVNVRNDNSAWKVTLALQILLDLMKTYMYTFITPVS
jgi:hypothetical protein